VYKRQALRFAEGLSTNDAITRVMHQVNLLEFKELIPSFNEIFIQVVNETNA
jgi:ABC-2 type transport system ATP-binding protein